MELMCLEQLELLREKMIETGMQYGLQDAKTIKISRQLDALLNEYANIEKVGYNSMRIEKNIY